MTAADRPRVGDQITTAAELDALPEGSVLRSHKKNRKSGQGRLVQVHGSGFYSVEGLYASAAEVGLPATVLHVPGERPGPSTADVEGIVRSLMAMSAVTGQDARAVVDAALALAADRPSVTDDARAEAELRAENVAAWNTTEYVEGYKYGFRRGAEWAAGRAETTTEWGVRSTDTGVPYQRHDEEDARHVAARQGWAVVRREVTAWTEADR